MEQGHRVTVISQRSSAHNGASDLSTLWERLDEAFVYRLPSPSNPRLRKLSTLFSMVMTRTSSATWWTRNAIRTGQRLVAGERFDMVVSRGITIENLYVGYCIARAAGLKLVSIINDPPMFCFPPPYVNRKRNPYLKRAELKLLKYILDGSALAVFPCDRLRRYIEKLVEAPFGNNTHISPHIGLATTGVEQRSDILEILHAGRIVRGRTADPFLRAFREALEIRPGMKGKIRLHILGAIDEPGEKMAAEMGLTDVATFYGSVSYDESLKMISAADALLLIEAPMEEGIFLPSKLCDYAVAKKPLLLFSPKNGAAADLVGAEHPGVLGQEYHETLDRLIRFLDAWETGRDLTPYLHPEPRRLKGDYLVKELLARVK